MTEYHCSRNVGFLVHIIVRISWHPRGRKRSVLWYGAMVHVFPAGWSFGRRHIPYISKCCMKNCRVEIGNTPWVPWVSAPVQKLWSRQVFLEAWVDHRMTVSHQCDPGKCIPVCPLRKASIAQSLCEYSPVPLRTFLSPRIQEKV